MDTPPPPRVLLSALSVNQSPSSGKVTITGDIRTWRPEIGSLDVGEGIEVVETEERSRNQRLVLDEEPERDEDVFDAPLAEALANPDPDSEEEGENLDVEELQLILEDSEPEDDEERGNFQWSADYSTFQSQREEFREVTGPKNEGTVPLDLFLQIWDQPIVTYIEEETNKYAAFEIEKAAEIGIGARSRLNLWKPTTADEIYRLMAIMMLMGMCVRGRIDEYWGTGLLEMRRFRKIMSMDRFWLLMKFIHFTDNAYSLPLGHPKRKLEKIEHLIKYINQKFTAIYTPRREISIDESLLLWKGFLRWIMCIRTKAARFGMKTYELCEAVTGYCVKFMFYTGKGTIPEEPLYGFTSSTAKTVLHMMQGFLGKGYTLFMDNFYNSVGLCRFLKRHQTDVVGTLNRRRTDTPAEVKGINDRHMARGDVVSRHCGDVSVVAWKDKKLVSTVSTYHNADMAPGRRAGQDIMKPEVVHTYNAFMGGVDLKDQKLSMYLLERKRGLKWYIKVFRRLLNTSILNAYIIHCANVGENGRKLTHRQFRLALAEELIQRFGDDVVPRTRSTVQIHRLDSSLNHFPQHKEVDGDRNSTKQNRFKRGMCVRCTKHNARKSTNIVCSSCDVFLCVGECWHKYHTEENF